MNLSNTLTGARYQLARVLKLGQHTAQRGAALLLFCALIGLGSTAFGQTSGTCYNASNSYGFCSAVEITRLYVTASGTVNIGTSADESQMTVCTPAVDVYVKLNMNDENAQEIFSTLLAAHLANRTVMLRMKTVAATGDCEIAYIMLDS